MTYCVIGTIDDSSEFYGTAETIEEAIELAASNVTEEDGVKVYPEIYEERDTEILCPGTGWQDVIAKDGAEPIAYYDKECDNWAICRSEHVFDRYYTPTGGNQS